MTNYRAVVRHVRYWRGAVHKWSTVYPFVGTLSVTNQGTALNAIFAMEQSILYPGTAPHSGGIWELAMYDQSSGGVPTFVQSKFDPDTPTAWVNYTGASWSPVATPVEQAAETSMVVTWAAGLSKSGKPVEFRKWYHQVPQATATPPVQDIAPAVITAIEAEITAGINIVGGLGAPMGSGGRFASLSPIVQPFYGNHQMPRGRRRKALVTASGRYTGPTVQVPDSVVAD
jgi:hypothetical protein